jgi:hypothetical protein
MFASRLMLENKQWRMRLLARSCTVVARSRSLRSITTPSAEGRGIQEIVHRLDIALNKIHVRTHLILLSAEFHFIQSGCLVTQSLTNKWVGV